MTPGRRPFSSGGILFEVKRPTLMPVNTVRVSLSNVILIRRLNLARRCVSSVVRTLTASRKFVNKLMMVILIPRGLLLSGLATSTSFDSFRTTQLQLGCPVLGFARLNFANDVQTRCGPVRPKSLQLKLHPPKLFIPKPLMITLSLVTSRPTTVRFVGPATLMASDPPPWPTAVQQVEALLSNPGGV